MLGKKIEEAPEIVAIGADGVMTRAPLMGECGKPAPLQIFGRCSQARIVLSSARAK